MTPDSCIFPYIESTKIINLRCLSFVISSNLLPRCMLDRLYFPIKKFIYILAPLPLRSY